MYLKRKEKDSWLLNIFYNKKFEVYSASMFINFQVLPRYKT